MAMMDVPSSTTEPAAAQAQRVQAVRDCGFTERQARFLIFVMRHAGVCVPRQYATFAGIANGGRRCNAFFDRLPSEGVDSRVKSGACTPGRASITPRPRRSFRRTWRAS